MKLFVPGRLCLFGEHSDWAGGYRFLNPQIEKGYTIVVGIAQGIYADVKPHPTHLIIKTTLNNDSLMQSFQLHKHQKKLLAEARRGGFFSYVAGVAYQVINNYSVGGLEINNYFTDLPIGLLVETAPYFDISCLPDSITIIFSCSYMLY